MEVVGCESDAPDGETENSQPARRKIVHLDVSHKGQNHVEEETGERERAQRRQPFLQDHHQCAQFRDCGRIRDERREAELGKRGACAIGIHEGEQRRNDEHRSEQAEGDRPSELDGCDVHGLIVPGSDLSPSCSRKLLLLLAGTFMLLRRVAL